MGYINLDACTLYRGAQGPSASVIYVVDLPEHPFDIATAAAGCAANVVSVPVRSWDDALTPWPAPGVRRQGGDFGGAADLTRAELTERVVPELERAMGLAPAARALCGYSLGGLFALYAFVCDARWRACGCLSGSLWYPGWVAWLCDRLQGLDGTGRFAYLSLGTKERRGGAPIMHSVQDNMEECAELLRGCGCAVEVRLGPGNHMQFHTERLAAGLAALDAYLSGSTVPGAGA